MRFWAVALLVGALGTAIAHHAVVISGFDRVPGDEGDARTLTFIAEHWYKAARGHAAPRSPSMFHPVPDTIGYTDAMLAHAVPYAVLRMAGVEMFSAMAAAVVLLRFLNYLACVVLLARVLRFHIFAACAGALFFAFNSPTLNNPGHFNLQPAFFLPLVVGALVHVARTAGSLTRGRAFGWLALAALGLNAQLLAALYPGWIFVFWSVLFLAVALCVSETRAVLRAMLARFWQPLLGATLVGVVGLIPLALLYFPTIGTVGWRGYRMVVRLIPEPRSLLLMGDGNYVWGWLSAALTPGLRFVSTEHHIGIGLVASLAWLALTMWAIRNVLMRPWISVTILATTLVYVIGMKYGGDASPWVVVYLGFPGAKGLQGVARYVRILALPMAIAFAYVLHHAALRRAAHPLSWRRRCLTAALVLVVAFGLFEQLGRTRTFSGNENMTRLSRLAAQLPDDCTAFYAVAAPLRTRPKYEYQIDAMLISSLRGVPTLNGYSGHAPRDWALRGVEAPGYEAEVREWIGRHGLTGRICALEIGD